jgi:branched-chain amino acid transport system ATP-binding protein
VEGGLLDHIQKARNRRRETLDVIFQLFPVLAERQHQMAGTLSGGEQQMLATPRALMAWPNLLMTDEPAWGLPPLLVHRLCDTICQINQQG